MLPTYQRLGVHVMDSNLAVLRAARKKIAKASATTPPCVRRARSSAAPCSSTRAGARPVPSRDEQQHLSASPSLFRHGEA
jgi:hypothetical protein